MSISILISLMISLAILVLVYWLGLLLIGLISDARINRIIGTIWLVLCILYALGILLNVTGFTDLRLRAP